MSFFDGHKFSGESITHIARLLDNKKIGIWEYNTVSKRANWSAGFYTMLGYKPGEIECSHHNFFENLLYYDDKKTFLKGTDDTIADGATTVHIRLLTKTGGYQWFESTSEKYITEEGQVLTGIISNINAYKTAQLRSTQQEYLASETGRIAKIGGWEIDAVTKKLSLSRDIYDIFELQGDVSLDIEEAVSFFEPTYRPVLIDSIENAISFCKPYDMELQLRTAKNNVIWVRSKGIPIIDEMGICKTVRGIFQDIDVIKRRGLTLQSSINLLDDQNKRLQNFAYIVSHNLRSHAGNLKFMVNLYEESQLQDDQQEIFLHIKTISDSLNATMSHLDEIVKIQSEIGKERKSVNFETIFNNVTSALSANIAGTDATVNADFSGCTDIDYIPAYLESIFQNLLTNALKYKHPDRKPVVNCRTLKDGNNIYLVFDDNGLGIDLERHGDDLFGMYKTFHLNKDAKGIGLFITRNQVEALGGSIHVDSAVNLGTKFTIKLV